MNINFKWYASDMMDTYYFSKDKSRGKVAMKVKEHHMLPDIHNMKANTAIQDVPTCVGSEKQVDVLRV